MSQAAFPQTQPRRQVDPFDDWETAYSRDDEPPRNTELDKNVRLWQEANVPKPTYSILSSASSSTAHNGSSAGSRVPPPQALSPGPALTILKRPSAPSSSSSNASARASQQQSSQSKTLSEREREYEAARRRIYGQPPVPPTSPAPSAGAPDLETGVRNLALNGGARNTSGPGSNRRRGGKSGAGSSTSSVEKLGTAAAGGGGVRAPKGPSADAGGFGFQSETPNPAPRERSRSGRGSSRRGGGGGGGGGQNGGSSAR